MKTAAQAAIEAARVRQIEADGIAYSGQDFDVLSSAWDTASIFATVARKMLDPACCIRHGG